jgi:hypothetical protein
LQIPDILKVIYAPHKAFKEIAEKPTYMGPLLIVVLFVAANVGFAYVGMSKTYVEQLVPNGQNLDEWTQNSTLWTSNAIITVSDDAINGTYFGNRSIAFSITNSSQVWMQLTGIGSINCSSPSGYNALFFRLKQTSPQEKPQNATIYLYSTSPSDYFYNDFTQVFSNFTYNVWNNRTVPFASGWSSSNPSADWGNITGLKLDFTWHDNSNVTLLVDGLFFHGIFKPLLGAAGSSYLLNYALSGAMQFVITWVILGGVLYLLSKTLGAKLVWRLLLIVVGFILITMFVQALVNMIAYSTLPDVKYPLDLIGGVQGEGQVAYDLILEQTGVVTLIGRVTQIAIYVWTIALCGVGVRLLGELSWTKSFLAAVVAYLATLFVGSFLFG